MRNDDVDYGMEIVVHAAKETSLFIDVTDIQRYVLTLNKMILGTKDILTEPIIVGFNKKIAEMVFRGGTEECFKKIIQKTHVSYSSYRRTKKFPIFFGKTEFCVLEREKTIAERVKKIRNESKFICTSFSMKCNVVTNLHTKVIEYEKYISDCNSAKDFLKMADISEKKDFINYLRKCHNLSYREIGKMLDCSSTKIYRLVNK